VATSTRKICDFLTTFISIIEISVKVLYKCYQMQGLFLSAVHVRIVGLGGPRKGLKPRA